LKVALEGIARPRSPATGIIAPARTIADCRNDEDEDRYEFLTDLSLDGTARRTVNAKAETG